jgi:hypothetical protein
MSKLNYLHKVLNQTLKNGVSQTHEEVIIDGSKGITIKLYTKSGDSVERISISGKDDNFTMRVQSGEKKTEKTLTKEELMDELKKNKLLKFAADFAKTQKGGRLLGGRKTSKKVSKKSSKKVSKKGSKKSSKRTSKK